MKESCKKIFYLTFLLIHLRTLYAFELRHGDILLQDLDRGSLVKAIEAVTEGIYGSEFAHTGIFVRDGENEFVIEAVPGPGVGLTPLKSFLSRSSDNEGVPKTAVARIKAGITDFQHSVSRALSFIGSPYDKFFYPAKDMIYCSELVHHAFLCESGSVFPYEPMTFCVPGSVHPMQTWTDYFDKLGIEIPEGVLGISPALISLSDKVEMYFPWGKPDGYNLEDI